jgi:ribosomal protein L11 methyltransferase
MSWLSVAIVVDAALADALADALLEAGAVSADMADADAGTAFERAIFDEPGGEHGAWARARVSALFAVNADVQAAVRAACERANAGTPAFDVTRVDDQDWVRATQAQFGPQRISAKFWIVPGWCTPPDPSALNILLDPGLAFGTGSHPSTRLCLRWLERHVRPAARVIDFGCGSGILAIAAMKLGAASAHGVDIDPQAVLAARRNAVQNQVPAHFHSAAEGLPGPADIVVANILAHPLIVLAPLLATLDVPGGRIGLSGILAEQAAEVGAAYAGAYVMEPPIEEDGWVLLSGIRRGDDELKNGR